MALPGLDPNDPTPRHARNLVVAAGVSTGGSPEYKVILFGNKTSAGSETTDTLGELIADEADAEARMGTRSELFGMFRKFTDVDAGAEMYFVAVPESGGNTASFTWTVAGTATGVANITLEFMGESIGVSVSEGDDAATIAAAINAQVPNLDDGRGQWTASVLSAVVTVNYIHPGPRGTLPMNQARAEIDQSVGVTITKSAVTAGTTEDDGSAAFAAAAQGEFYYWVLPWHATATVTSTDGQIGEALAGSDGVKTAALPINGKEQTVHVGLVGTQAEATAVSTSAAANSSRGYFYRAENNDWSPAQLAAHHAGVHRALVVSHPAMPGAVGYTSTDGTVYNVPDPDDKDDRPTPAEIKADLNNGITPVAFDANGRARIPRIITSRSQNSSGANDYRAREGHITVVTDFFWGVVEQRYSELLQPFIAGNLKEGERPVPLTTTPAQVEDLIRAVITDLAGRTPQGARFTGPILAPDREQKMRDSVKVSKFTGGFRADVEIFAVEHLIKSETEVRETSAAY